MKKLILLSLCIACIASAKPKKSEDAPAVSGDVSAIVGKTTILRSKVLEAIEGLKEKPSTPEEKKAAYAQVLQQMVIMEILSQAALESGIENKKEFQDAVKKAMEQIRVQLYLQNLQQKAAEGVDKDVVKKEVDEMKKRGEQQVTMSQMVINGKDVAKSIEKALRNGTPFMTLAQKHSLDKNNISQGPVPLSMLPKEIADTAVGSTVTVPVSGDIVRIIKIETKEPMDPKLASKIATEKIFKQKMMEILKKLQDSTKTQMFDQDGNKIADEKKPEEKKAEDKK